ncbi:MAG TPA: hypothetical protein VGV89_02905 [Thermoplasmata archaeon]|nr:hypothetical protein [Thermoplasmata archaeon]
MVPTPRVAFVTMAAMPDGAPDDRLSFGAFEARGLAPVPAVWEGAEVDWAGFDLAILRSTWDYHRRREEFLRWLDRVESLTTVLNPPTLVRWNSHKGYLLELARQGHAVVPTELVRQDSAATLRQVVRARGWTNVVVKPAVSASSEGLFRAGDPPSGEEEARFAALRASSDLLVQPELAAVRDLGERSLVFFRGTFSHSAEYPYLLAEGIRSERYPTPRQPSADELNRCGRILRSLPQVPLYARLDFMPRGPNDWLLGELELIEPELLFRADPTAGDRFAAATRELLVSSS